MTLQELQLAVFHVADATSSRHLFEVRRISPFLPRERVFGAH